MGDLFMIDALCYTYRRHIANPENEKIIENVLQTFCTDLLDDAIIRDQQRGIVRLRNVGEDQIAHLLADLLDERAEMLRQTE